MNGLDCRKCNNQLKETRGCGKEVESFTIGDVGITVNRCPMHYCDDFCFAYMHAYFEYTKGYLPNEGGWLDQPMKFSRVIVYMDKLIDGLEAKKDKTAGY